MTLRYILVFLLLVPLIPHQRRPVVLLVLSVGLMAWLQYPHTMLALVTLMVIGSVWWITQYQVTTPPWVLIACSGLIWLTTGWAIGGWLALMGVVFIGAISLHRLIVPTTETARPYRLALLGVLLLIGLLVGGKLLGWAWVGFSYIAFRLMGVLLDYRQGRLPTFTLSEFVTYVLFFPTLSAGPIDHAPRFIDELRHNKPLEASSLVIGMGRVAIGAFKKFVIADSLARISLTPTLVAMTESRAGLWVWIYVYSFHLFFDFSGYSDIAIGIGRLYGITLPENFDRPYLQRNLQQFWQRWHMTLSGWFRTYYFLPLSRWCIRHQWPTTLTLLLAQLSTMLLIGLWHGLTLNFALWGLWHGLGLWGHRWLVDHSHAWYRWVRQHQWLHAAIRVGGVGLTFHYVTLGWVFFALPHTADSLDLLYRLVGIR